MLFFVGHISCIPWNILHVRRNGRSTRTQYDSIYIHFFSFSDPSGSSRRIFDRLLCIHGTLRQNRWNVRHTYVIRRDVQDMRMTRVCVHVFSVFFTPEPDRYVCFGFSGSTPNRLHSIIIPSFFFNLGNWFQQNWFFA